MKAAKTAFGIPESHISIEDNSECKDGMNEIWNMQIGEQLVDDFVKKNDIRKIITFDSLGVSSHPNHIAVSNIVTYFFSYIISIVFFLLLLCVCVYKKLFIYFNSSYCRRRHLMLWELETTNVLRKFIGVFDGILSLLTLKKNEKYYLFYFVLFVINDKQINNFISIFPFSQF